MQELRLVAVSEDGSYLVLATAGRGTRFTLPVDDRLRAAVRGHFSRLGQFEIEVESPLRPKEIQARIRAGETAEEIAESAGIPVDRVRWFEGPVLQEREYMAQQAQRVTVRRQGETSPSPPLGEMVEERLGRRGLDLEEVEWDSWKCEDSTWRVRLSFFDDGRPHAAEWVFDPRRRNVSPLDEMAAKLCSVDWDESANDTVTPLLPRRPAMKVVPDSRDAGAEQPRAAEPRRDYIVERGRFMDARQSEELPAESPGPPGIAFASAPPAPAPPAGGRMTERPPAAQEPPAPEPPRQEPEPAPPARAATAAPEPAPPARPERKPEPAPEPAAQEPPAAAEPAAAQPAAEPAAAEPAAAERDAPERDAPERDAPEPAAAEPAASEPAAAEPSGEERAAGARQRRAAGSPGKQQRRTTPEKKKVADKPPAPVERPAAAAEPAQRPPARNRRKAKGKRASVPSWDEIMFGARRPD